MERQTLIPMEKGNRLCYNKIQGVIQMDFLLDVSLFLSCAAIIILGKGESSDYLTAGGLLLLGLVDLIRRLKYRAAVRRKIAEEGRK